MIDLHCHILPGVDDGSRNIDETISLLKHALLAGFDTICFTPHYVEPEFLNTKEQNQQILNKIKTAIKQQNISINLLLGNEIFINDNIPELLENNTISTLANSNYVLIELPMYQELPEQIVHKLLNNISDKGFNIVIAHPERYTYIQKNPKKLNDYFGENVIFQGNYASIIGAYGKDAQKTLKKLLKSKQIAYLSSDVHHISRCFFDDFDLIKKKLMKIVTSEYYEQLTEINPKLIIENKKILL